MCNTYPEPQVAEQGNGMSAETPVQGARFIRLHIGQLGGFSGVFNLQT